MEGGTGSRSGLIGTKMVLFGSRLKNRTNDLTQTYRESKVLVDDSDSDDRLDSTNPDREFSSCKRNISFAGVDESKDQESFIALKASCSDDDSDCNETCWGPLRKAAERSRWQKDSFVVSDDEEEDESSSSASSEKEERDNSEVDEEEIEDLINDCDRVLGTARKSTKNAKNLKPKRKRIMLLSDSSEEDDENQHDDEEESSDADDIQIVGPDDFEDDGNGRYDDSFIDDAAYSEFSGHESEDDSYVSEVEVIDEDDDKEIVKESVKKSGSKVQLTFLESLSLNPDEVPGSGFHPEAIIYLKNYNKHKEELCHKLYKLYNKEAFNESLPKDMEMVWCPRLTKTAGVCCLISKRNPKDKTILERSCEIKLSLKVLDSADRLRDTLVHEMCHAAAWLVSGCKGGHGPVWKAWAGKVMKRFKELPVISRCHSYEIRTKYVYVCQDCGHKYGRHSKSIDVDKKCCGKCKGTLVLDNLKPCATPRQPGKYALFVKDNYKNVRTPGVSHGDAMKQLGSMFKSLKT